MLPPFTIKQQMQSSKGFKITSCCSIFLIIIVILLVITVEIVKWKTSANHNCDLD